MRDKPSTATLQQVADAAGVSLATASRVLHGSGGRTVREELRGRVLAEAARLRYVSHAPAQALARATTSIVGLIVHDIADPYFAAIAAGAMRAAREHDLMVMVACTFRDPALELEYIARLRAQRARAIVLAASAFTGTRFLADLAEQLDAYAHQGGRAAAIGNHGPAVDAVLPDNKGGGALAARHLLDCGHAEIGVVAGPKRLAVVADRLAGFRSVFPVDASHVEEGDFSRDGGYAATRRLLARHPSLTAVFALDDLMAFGAVAALQDAGRSVPGDVSVVGFDDIPGAADVGPGLTTIRLDLTGLGEKVLGLALSDLGPARQVITMPASLVVRASSRPLSS
ncbi:LacI family DNA-binding transcriptional regulator [Hamadaea tsunoensis]|uniref:LacI family DNA-binding transcriptional regulator n=1 Tax=Hamadaea tsunoensis TaxID=53368 RepID=UPI000427F2CE|nr:LacI family DNA-binding transcriptional regulator [Hamadaea tsunoensis]